MRRPSALVCCAFVVVVLAGPAAVAARLEEKAVEVGPGITPPQAAGLSVLETPDGVPEGLAHSTLTLRLLLDKSGQFAAQRLSMRRIPGSLLQPSSA